MKYRMLYVTYIYVCNVISIYTYVYFDDNSLLRYYGDEIDTSPTSYHDNVPAVIGCLVLLNLYHFGDSTKEF